MYTHLEHVYLTCICYTHYCNTRYNLIHMLSTLCSETTESLPSSNQTSQGTLALISILYTTDRTTYTDASSVTSSTGYNKSVKTTHPTTFVHKTKLKSTPFLIITRLDVTSQEAPSTTSNVPGNLDYHFTAHISVYTYRTTIRYFLTCKDIPFILFQTTRNTDGVKQLKWQYMEHTVLEMIMMS